ncbi:MAG: CHAD domain-containing protein [Sulfurospirillaceae bacterium]|nr:CHAD domain-containing protein [Sulfurospirillaceae bacterium]
MCTDGQCLEQNSVKTLLQTLLQKTLQNAQAHFEDFTHTNEPESLHQYRVNLRMLRSVCKEFFDYLSPKRGLFLLDYLKMLQKDTNHLRDIDVFIECINDYKSKVSPECVALCHKIEAKLFKDRAKSITQLYTKQSCAKRAHYFDELLTLLVDAKLYRKKAEKTVLKPIKKIIAHRLQKIKKLSSHLSLESPNEQFHNLRLHYKKIRYTTDCACLGNREHALNAFSQSFKPLQTALGEVQDKNTQIGHLRELNLKHDVCAQQFIAMIEDALREDKQNCIEISSKAFMDEMKQTFQAIFA